MWVCGFFSSLFKATDLLRISFLACRCQPFNVPGKKDDKTEGTKELLWKWEGSTGKSIATAALMTAVGFPLSLLHVLVALCPTVIVS